MFDSVLKKYIVNKPFEKEKASGLVASQKLNI